MEIRVSRWKITRTCCWNNEINLRRYKRKTKNVRTSRAPPIESKIPGGARSGPRSRPVQTPPGYVSTPPPALPPRNRPGDDGRSAGAVRDVSTGDVRRPSGESNGPPPPSPPPPSSSATSSRAYKRSRAVVRARPNTVVFFFPFPGHFSH